MELGHMLAIPMHPECHRVSVSWKAITQFDDQDTLLEVTPTEWEPRRTLPYAWDEQRGLELADVLSDVILAAEADRAKVEGLRDACEIVLAVTQ